MTEWDTLIPHVIHDVRALIRTGMSSAQLLERKLGTQADPEATAWLGAMISSQRDLNVLMLRLGALAQADKPLSPGRDEPLDLEAVVLSAKLHCLDALKQCGAELSIGPLPRCRVPARLETALAELLSNSCRFRDLDRPLQIRIEAFHEEGTLSVCLTDNGRGWSPGSAEKLFQPLQCLSAAGGGLGLGLAIARATVESMGGQIRAELGSPGARFHILVPVVDEI